MKRKLSDLKENDVIRITSKKDCRKIQKLINKSNITWFLDNKVEGERSIENYFKDGVIYLFDVNSGMCYDNRVAKIKSKHNVIPASYFIKPKKSKLKKVWQEIARMDGRIADLEADKTKPDLALGLECETKELTELPKKWCVKITEENKTALKQYWNSLKSPNYVGFKGWLLSDSYDGSFLHWGDARGYTKISFSDFERLVLNKPKKIIQEKEIDWGESQLVVGLSDNVVILTDGIHDTLSFGGIVVQGHENRNFGDYCSSWSKISFKPFKGEITLKNE